MQKEKLRILEDVLGPYQRSGHEYLYSCPKCNHHKKKLSVNIGKDVWKCWICEYKGHKIHRLIRRYGSLAARAEWESISPIEIPSDLRDYVEQYFSEEEEIQIVKLPEEFETLSTFKRSGEHMKARHYLYSRGLTDWDILYWKIGLCPSGPYGGRVIIPSFDNKGNVNFFIGRAYKNFNRKYKNPRIDKSRIIFNELYVDWTKDLVLVEGIFDAMKADNSLPILGSTMGTNHKIFQEIIRHDTPVYVALDKDAIEKAFKLIEKLIRYEIEVYKIDTTQIGTDVGDLSKEEFSQLKSDSVLMTTNELFKEKLRMIM